MVSITAKLMRYTEVDIFIKRGRRSTATESALNMVPNRTVSGVPNRMMYSRASYGRGADGAFGASKTSVWLAKDIMSGSTVLIERFMMITEGKHNQKAFNIS